MSINLNALLLVALTGLFGAGLGQAAPRPFVADSYQQLLAEQQERPLLLVLWSLDCPPCIEEMPELAAFARRFPEVAVTLVSVDGPGAEADVDDLLAEMGLNRTDSWLFAEPQGVRLRYAIDPDWRGELPRSYLYLPGEQRHRIRGRIDFERLSAYLAQRGGAGR